MELHDRSYSKPLEQTTVYPGIQRTQTAPGRLEGGAARVSGLWNKVRVSENLSRRSVTLEPSQPGSRPASNQFKAIGMNREVKLQDEDGQDLKAVHTYKGKVLGMEVAIRVPGQKALSIVLERSAQYLLAKKAELEELPPTAETKAKIEAINKKIEINTKQRQSLQTDTTSAQRKFFDSNYHREFMKGAVAGKKLDAASYETLALKANPGLVNARSIKLLQNDGSQHGLLRLGVMSDLTNGTTNLRELKEIVQERKENGGKMTARQEQAIKSLEERMKAYDPGTPARASLEMAVEQMKNPEKALEIRQERMDLQMLQYLAVQAERDPSKLDGENWNVVDVRLLSPSKDEMDVDSGWVHNEANEMRDMQEIFKAYSGKTIVLDGQGPYVDDKGKVHLPLQRGGREITLKAAMLNISIQGNTSNQEVQQQINKEALEQLKDNPDLQKDDNWKGMLELLASGESNGTVAEMAVTGLVKSGFCVSLGCLSAKDRTGWVAGRAVIKLMADTQPEVRKYLTTQLIGAKSVASQVLKDVTGWRFMKLDYKTMGADATFALKMRHTLGLASEWGVNLVKQKMTYVAEQLPKARDRIFSYLINS